MTSDLRDGAPGRGSVTPGLSAGRWAGVFADWRVPALLAAGMAANLVLQGFEFPSYNNVFHVPIVLGYAASAEGPHDAFDLSLANFTSVLWPLLSLIATERTVSALFFAVYALNRAALIVLLYLTASELLPVRRNVLAIAVGVVVLLWWTAWPLSPLGGNDLFVRALSQTGLAVTGLVACLWLTLRRRWLATAICLGVSFNVNAFMAFWGGVIAAATYLRMEGAASRRTVHRNLAILGCASAIVALPTLVWIGLTLQAGPSGAPFDYRAYIAEFYPRHNLLDGNLNGVLIAAMVAWIVWAYTRDKSLIPGAWQKGVVATAFATVCAILLVGMAMPYLVNSRLLYCLFPLRMDGYLIAPLMIVLMSAALARTYDSSDGGAFWSEALVLVALANGNAPLAVFAVAARTRTGCPVAVVLLLAAGIFVAASGEVPIYYRPDPLRALGLSLGQVFVAVLVTQTRGSPTYLLVSAALIAPAAIPDPLGTWSRAAAAILYVGSAGTVAGWERWIAWNQTAAARLSWLARPRGILQVRTWAGPVIIAAAIAAGIVRLGMAGTLNYLSAQDRANVDAQLWLRQHSKPDETVLALDTDGFSTLSRRPVWADRKIGSAVMWAPWYYWTWHTRMADISRLHTIAAAIDYARAHRLAYIVMSRDYASRAGDQGAHSVAYSNPFYVVLRRDGTAPAPR